MRSICVLKHNKIFRDSVKNRILLTRIIAQIKFLEKKGMLSIGLYKRNFLRDISKIKLIQCGV